MSKKHKRIDVDQLNIFSYLKPGAPPAAGSMNVDIALRHAVSQAIKGSGKDRIDICAELYKLTGIEVSKATLDGWSAESRSRSSESIDYNHNKRWGIPAEMVSPFCHVCGDYDVLHLIAEAGHYKALKGKDIVRARIGELNELISKKTLEKKNLEKALLKAN